MTRPLNFLQVTTFYPPYSFGGDAVQVYRLAHALAQEGHHVDVVHCVDSYNLLHRGPTPVAYADHPNVVRHELRSPFGPLSPALTYLTGKPALKARSLAHVLQSRRFDVIHFHNISLLGPGILSLKPKLGETVKVYTTHEHWLVCPTHVLWKFNQEPCTQPECLRCTLQSRRPPRAVSRLHRMNLYAATALRPSPRRELRSRCEHDCCRVVGP